MYLRVILLLRIWWVILIWCNDVGGDETAPGTESAAAAENGEETAAAAAPTADSTAAESEQVKPEGEVKTDPQQQTEADTEEKGAADAQESEKVSVPVILCVVHV